MPTPRLTRRALLAGLGLPALQGCTAPLPRMQATSSTPEAKTLLAASAAAHGSAALQAVNDISVSYAGTWHAFVNLIQPDLVDAGFRGTSQERILLPARLTAQSHTGPNGHKEVVRQTPPGSQGNVRVWYDGHAATGADTLAAAALVADGYGLFLLGPMLLAGAGRSLLMERDTFARITVFGQNHACDVLRIRLRPGLGLSPQDDLAVFISRGDRLMRRVRFTLNGLDATQGAVAEVDTAEHVTAHGIAWPTRFHERLIRPAPIPVHDWRLTGLDVNRGLTEADIGGAALAGKALPPARW